MQLVKRTDDASESHTTGTAPVAGGLAGWLIAAFARWKGDGWMRRAAGRQKTLRLLETLPLGGRRQLLLVSCAGEQFLVGAGPDSVSSLLRVGVDLERTAEGGAMRRAESRV